MMTVLLHVIFTNLLDGDPMTVAVVALTLVSIVVMVSIRLGGPGDGFRP